MGKERPILFSGPMVRALLEGRKTQTRRLVTPDPGPLAAFYKIDAFNVALFTNGQDRRCPHGTAVDTLWVRETWAQVPYCRADGNDILYRSDRDYQTISWRPSIFMPRWASRLTLRITSVRVERLQDISEEDAVAEGCTHTGLNSNGTLVSADEIESAREQFARLWDGINGKRAPWASSPWVWVLGLERVEVGRG